MTRFTHFMGFISLWYIWYHVGTWHLIPNETNVVSRAIIKVCGIIPNFIVSTLVIIMLMLLCLNFILNRKTWIVNIFSRVFFVVILMIGTNMLMLEETTTLYLAQIHHPIGIEYKVHYFDHMLMEILESQKSPYFYNPGELVKLEPVQQILENIQNMNVSQINEATIRCVKTIHQVPVVEYKEASTLSIISTISAFIGLFLFFVFT